MKRNRLYTIACSTAILLFAWPAAAQNNNRFNWNIGGGFTAPVNDSDGRLNYGYNVNAGAGVNLAPAFGVNVEYGFNNMGVASTLLSTIGVPQGEMRVHSVTLNPIVRFNPNGRFDFYLIGGGGWYRRTVEFSEPSVATIAAFDPFFGVFFPVDVPSNTILGSFTQNKGGLNIGGGITAQLKGDSNLKFFAESRYHHIWTEPVRTHMLPVTFGLRW
jgi:opacity protein-like surface antigen